MPTLETQRLIMRRPELTDAPSIQVLAADYDIAKNLLQMPHPYPEGGASSWINSAHEAEREGEKDFSFVITRKADGEYIGSMGIHLDHENQRAEIGYWLGKPYWGQGYATEAAVRLLQFGFEELRLNRIYARCFSENIGSERVMQKIGMQYEGLLRQEIYKWGQYIDLKMYAVLRSDHDDNH
ncbi:MAG: GNAT family N-acetyltransferase [Burkholderiales bacterium]|nr:GNAT family N-acetyltransferase [Anaerolineae bacterium]